MYWNTDDTDRTDLHGFVFQIRADQCHPCNPCSSSSFLSFVNITLLKSGFSPKFNTCPQLSSTSATPKRAASGTVFKKMRVGA